MEGLRNKDFYLTLTVNFEKVVIIMLFLVLVFQVAMIPFIFRIDSNVQMLKSDIDLMKVDIQNCKVVPSPQNTTVDEKPPSEIKVNLENAHKLGNGKVPIIVFSDYQCPYSERGYQTEKQLRSQYGSDITIYFKNFPLNQIHPQAQKASEAAECASEQGKFWEYHDYLYEHQSELSIDNLTTYADILGLERPKFDICLTAGNKAKKVSDDMTEGISLGVQGTPTYLIGNTQIVGAQPFATFEKEILAQR